MTSNGQSTDPERAEVLGWMRRNPGPHCAQKAAEHFWPGVSPDDQKKKATLYRKWAQLERERTGAPPPPAQATQRQAPAPPPLEEPCYEMADATQLERLREAVAQLWADSELLRRVRDFRTAALLKTQAIELGQQLEALRAKAARAVKVDRTATGVAAELARKAPAINLRAEKLRRAQERARAEQQPKERDL